MRIIGIDPGTATTGYGVITENSKGDLIVVDFGAITTPADLCMPDRLVLLYKRMNELILLHHPDGGAVEKLFFHRNVTTALSVGQARGVVLLALAEAGLSIAEYTPLEVKQAVVGYGGADKNQVQQMVKALLGLAQVPKPDDAADALAIAICHLNSARFHTQAAQAESG